MADEGEQMRVDPGYAVAELLRALASTSEQAHRRAGEWRRLLSGILDGTLTIGSRTPVKDTPVWVTLDVLHGGFATGGFAAGGELLPHELDKLAQVPRGPGVTERAALNGYYLSDRGRAELAALLESGRYRVTVPEEAALLVNAWLLQRGEADAAEALLREIAPFFDRLRFYPPEHPRPQRAVRGVSLETAGETRARLEARKPQADVRRLIEAVRIWAPLYDRAVALFLETVEGEPPRLNAGTVEGGFPCRRFPADFRERAAAILGDYQRLRARHRLCKKPDKPKENFARLRRLLGVAAADPSKLGERDTAELRRVLASFVTAHGAPGSAAHTALRQAQAVEAERPLHHQVAAILSRRLATLPADEGVVDFEPVVRVLSEKEAADAGCGEGARVPPELIARARRCLEAPLGKLVELELVPSSESMARLLPPLTAAARTMAIEEPSLRALFASTYTAFRRRRSLLLLNLESQAKLTELPWLHAVKPWIGGGGSSAQASRAVLDDAATLAIQSFPHSIVPNKLVKELRALGVAAGTPLPFVEELAADIFMGAFSELFSRAAKLAAALLQGTLYERYYGLPYARILSLNDVTERHGTPVSDGFAAICAELAVKSDKAGDSVARNGTLIEQAQILTTHNLAALFVGTDAGERLRPELGELARRCFRWICRRQQTSGTPWPVRLRLQKNTAYAWRQLVFYLTLADPAELDAFLVWSSAHLAQQPPDFRARFAPVLAGLELAARGESFDADGRHASGARRFLGWSLGRHWLMPPE